MHKYSRDPSPANLIRLAEQQYTTPMKLEPLCGEGKVTCESRIFMTKTFLNNWKNVIFKHIMKTYNNENNYFHLQG